MRPGSTATTCATSSIDSNGSVIDFNQFGTPMDFNANHTKDRQPDRNQAGANLKWSATENLKFEADGFDRPSVRNPSRNGTTTAWTSATAGTITCPNASDCDSGPVVRRFGRAVRKLRRVRQHDPRRTTGVQITGPSSSDLPVIHDVGPAGNVSPVPRHDEDGFARHRALRNLQYGPREAGETARPVGDRQFQADLRRPVH